MGELSLVVTQSKYFTPAFNTAIFDGAVRIYFSQAQEEQALQLYFAMQARWKEKESKQLQAPLQGGGNVFVMLYPNQEIYSACFDAQKEFSCEQIGSDFVIGVEVEKMPTLQEQLFSQVEQLLESNQTQMEWA